MLNGFLWSVFQGIKDAREENEYERKIKQLNMEMDCWIGTARTGLLDVSELNELTDGATSEEHYNEILDHLYHFDATRVPEYEQIERKIINKMWE